MIEEDEDDVDDVEFQTETVDLKKKKGHSNVIKHIFSFSCTLFKTKKRCFIFNRTCEKNTFRSIRFGRFLSSRFFRYKKSQNLIIFSSFEKLHKKLKWNEINGRLFNARHLITDEKFMQT